MEVIAHFFISAFFNCWFVFWTDFLTLFSSTHHPTIPFSNCKFCLYLFFFRGRLYPLKLDFFFFLCRMWWVGRRRVSLLFLLFERLVWPAGVVKQIDVGRGEISFSFFMSSKDLLLLLSLIF